MPRVQNYALNQRTSQLPTRPTLTRPYPPHPHASFWGLSIGFHSGGGWALGHLAFWLVSCTDWQACCGCPSQEGKHGGGGKRARGFRVTSRRRGTVALAAVWPLHALRHWGAAWAWPGSWAGFFPDMEGEAWGRKGLGGSHRPQGRRDSCSLVPEGLGFLTTEPPRKPLPCYLIKLEIIMVPTGWYGCEL